MADDELWHVRISADEVKTLTLEQIDDLYRLDVIDADTQLWQDGMDEWLPLRVVAGLDEPEVVNVSIPPTVPPPRMGTTMSSWPPAGFEAPAAARSARPAPPSMRPAAPSMRPPISRPPPAPLADTATSWPPAPNAALAATVPSRPPITRPPPAPLPFDLSPSYAPPASTSVRPQMLSPLPHVYAKPLNPMPIVLAAIVGVVVTLYRNDMLHAGARTVGQEAAYLKLEAALGGPGFGTPRAVESMAKAAAALPDIAPLPVSTSASKVDSSSSTSSDSSSTSRSTSTTTVAKSLPVSQPEPHKAAAPSPQPQSASRTAPTRPVAAEAPDPVFKQPKGAKKAKGNEFDPLNPNL